MNPAEAKIFRLSSNQLRALNLLAKSKSSIISSSVSANQIGKKGKALGGVFSSLARQRIQGQRIVVPWGKSEYGRGLRWKLNEKLIKKDRLLQVTKELLTV